MVRGVKTAASGIGKGAHAAGRAADKVARKAGLTPAAAASAAHRHGPR